jgi:hypothetical protein
MAEPAPAGAHCRQPSRVESAPIGCVIEGEPATVPGVPPPPNAQLDVAPVLRRQAAGCASERLLMAGSMRGASVAVAQAGLASLVGVQR